MFALHVGQSRAKHKLLVFSTSAGKAVKGKLAGQSSSFGTGPPRQLRSQLENCNQKSAIFTNASTCSTETSSKTLLQLSRQYTAATGHGPAVGGALTRQFLGLGRNLGTAKDAIAQSFGGSVVALWEARVQSIPSLEKAIGAICLSFARYNVPTRVAALIVGELTRAYHNRASAELLHDPRPVSSRAAAPPSAVLARIKGAFEGVILVLRAVYLLLLFTPAIVLAPFASHPEGRIRRLWLHLVHKSLEQAGAAFIKWGQWAATRPDLFPKDMCAELSKLHQQAPAHSFKVTKKTVERAFGRSLGEVFEFFDEKPIASGSIAQVHSAVLRQGGPGLPYGSKDDKLARVAVKVRHPGVTDVIRRDFVLMNAVAKLASLTPGLRDFRLEDSVQQFAVFMIEQVDLAREAAHLSRFIYNFRRWKDVSFPSPRYPLVHPEVLVESFETGESVLRFVERSKQQDINTHLAHIGTHTLLKMLLVDNFIHADLHPGNILVRMKTGPPTHPRKWKPHPHLCLLDVGMTAELQQEDRGILLELFKGVALRDGRKVATQTLRFSKKQTCPDPEAFINEVESTFRKFSGKKAGSMHTGEAMTELLEQVRRHRVSIDGSICTVIVTTLVLEGWQRKLDPDLDIMTSLQALLFKSDWATNFSHTIDALMGP